MGVQHENKAGQGLFWSKVRIWDLSCVSSPPLLSASYSGCSKWADLCSHTVPNFQSISSSQWRNWLIRNMIIYGPQTLKNGRVQTWLGKAASESRVSSFRYARLLSWLTLFLGQHHVLINKAGFVPCSIWQPDEWAWWAVSASGRKTKIYYKQPYAVRNNNCVSWLFQRKWVYLVFC